MAVPLWVLLCLPPLVVAEEASVNRALGLMMMGAIFLVMGVIYLTHWPDHDIRKVTWMTINNTISIFCAVILFNNVKELLSTEGSAFEQEVSVSAIAMNRFHVIGWYLCLCAGLAWCAGIGAGLKWRKEVLESPLILARRKAKMKCCLFFAHTTGFAGIYGWGMKQNASWFRQSPLHSALLIPYAFVWYVGLIIFAMVLRDVLYSQSWLKPIRLEKDSVEEGGETRVEKDELVSLGEEMLQDGENDFIGLFLSFLVASSLRFLVGGRLPDEEGEEGEAVFHHGVLEAFGLYTMSLLCFCAAWAILLKRKKFFDLHEMQREKEKGKLFREGEEEKAMEEAFEKFMGSATDLVKEHWLKEMIRSHGGRGLSRMVDLAVDTFGFSFAWCFMYATQWLMAPWFIGDELVLGISLALVVTLCGCQIIYLLDREADKTELKEHRLMLVDNQVKEVEKEDVVCRKLMEGMGVLIGFVWEKCFDGALVGVAGGGSTWLKPILGILTVLVIMPVWLWYIVPMETSEGYLLGVLPHTTHANLDSVDLDREPKLRRVLQRQLEITFDVMWEKDPKFVQETVQDLLRKYPPAYTPPNLGESAGSHAGARNL